MMSVDLIGQTRRAYFEQGRPIKEIVRTLSVSRATVRKVIRGVETTAFRYTARTAQPSPKLGPWIKDLVEILEAEAKLPRRERRSRQRLFETLRGRGYPPDPLAATNIDLVAAAPVGVRVENLNLCHDMSPRRPGRSLSPDTRTVTATAAALFLSP